MKIFINYLSITAGIDRTTTGTVNFNFSACIVYEKNSNGCGYVCRVRGVNGDRRVRRACDPREKRLVWH